MPALNFHMIKVFIQLTVTGLLILTVSCRKQYSCQCSTTYEKPGYYPYTVSSIEPIDKKTTKKRANVICAHAEKQITNNNSDYKSADETMTVSCAVK